MVAQPSAGPRIVSCKEQGPLQLPIRDLLQDGELRLNPEIESGDFFAVSLSKGKIVLRARGYVGLIPLTSDIVVKVEPRVPVQDNLERILQLSGEPPTVLSTLRGYAPGEEWNESLLDVYASALIQHVERISLAGLWREYSRREEVSSFPKGRILLHRTMQQQISRGVRHAATVAWWERTVDTPANRCLKYAVWFVAQQYIRRDQTSKSQRALLRRLNALYSVFDGVALDSRGAFLTDGYVTGRLPLPTLRSYYRDALNVGVAVAEQRTVLIDSASGSIRLPAIVMNMNYVFERYIRNALRTFAVTQGWAARVLDGNDAGARTLFNGKSQPRSTPDITVENPDGTVAVALEVKNVPIRDGSGLSERSHLNQTVTYALTHRTKKVVLVHPRASEHQQKGLRLLGEVDQVSVYQYRYDLSANSLADEDAYFGSSIGSLLA